MKRGDSGPWRVLAGWGPPLTQQEGGEERGPGAGSAPAPGQGLSLVLVVLLLLLSVGMLVQGFSVYGGLLFTEFCLLLLPAWLAGRRLNTSASAGMALFSGSRVTMAAGMGTGVFAFLLALAFTVPLLIGVAWLGGHYPGLNLPLSTSRQFLLALLSGAVAAPLCEEIVFRGFLLRSLRCLGPHQAVWVAGVLFGMFHLDPVRFVPTAILGVVYGYLAAATGSLLAPILAHATNNALALSLAYAGSTMDPQGPQGLTREGLREAVRRTAESGEIPLPGGIHPDLILLLAALLLLLAGVVLSLLLGLTLKGWAGPRGARWRVLDCPESGHRPLRLLVGIPALWGMVVLVAGVWGLSLYAMFSDGAAS